MQCAACWRTFTESSGSLLDSIAEDRSDLNAIFDACQAKLDKPLAPDAQGRPAGAGGPAEREGVFHLQRSVPYVAERMGVSKYTILQLPQ